jgi:hypothetical protein
VESECGSTLIMVGVIIVNVTVLFYFFMENGAGSVHTTREEPLLFYNL